LIRHEREKVESETWRGEVEGSHDARWRGTRKCFDSEVFWSLGPKGAEIHKFSPLESARRDADLYYSLHEPDYFTRLKTAGVPDFEGHRCYWLRGTTHGGKDNNQFYDVKTGVLVGYRFQSDDKSATMTILVFDNYKSFGGQLVATKQVGCKGD
jgi:hypothetical protein